MALVASGLIRDKRLLKLGLAIAIVLLATVNFLTGSGERLGAEPTQPRGQARQDGASAYPSVSDAIRAVRNPPEASLSGGMFFALEATVRYRVTKQRSRLRSSELLPGNFLLTIKSAQNGVFLTEQERREHCYEVSWAPQVMAGEEVVLHRAEMRLGRYALYVVCGRDNNVVRSQLGAEEPEHSPGGRGGK